MFDKHHKKENPTFTGITRGVGGFGFGVATSDGGEPVPDNWHLLFRDDTGKMYSTAVTDLHIDSQGFIYVCGYYSSGNSVILKFNSDAELQWGRLYTAGSIVFKAVDTDSSSNVYLSGYYMSSDGQGINSNNRMLTTKINSSGVRQWTRELSYATNNTEQYGFGVAVDSSGNVYNGGSTYQTGSAASRSYLLAKYNSNGVIQWQKTWYSTAASSGSYQHFILNLAYTSGNEGLWSAGVSTLYDPGGTYSGYTGARQAIHITNWNITTGEEVGGCLFHTPVGAATGQGGTSIAAYGTDVYVVSDILSGGYNPYPNSGSDLLITRLDSSRNEQWTRIVGLSEGSYVDQSGRSSNGEFSGGIAVDSSGNAYVLARLKPTSNYYFDAIILKYNSSGFIQWQRFFRSSLIDYVQGNTISVDNLGNFYISTHTDTPEGGGQGNESIILAKLPVDGSLTGTYGDFTYVASSFQDLPRSSFSDINFIQNFSGYGYMQNTANAGHTDSDTIYYYNNTESITDTAITESDLNGTLTAIQDSTSLDSGIEAFGLDIYLDANDSNSYSGSGTTWTNLAPSGIFTNATLRTTSGLSAYTSSSPSYFTNLRAYIPLTYNRIRYYPFTYSVWVYPTALSNYSSLIDQGNDKFLFCFYQSDIDLYPHASDGIINLNLNTWYNLTVTYTFGENFKFYKDGVLQSTASFTQDSVDNDDFSNWSFGSGSISSSSDGDNEDFVGRYGAIMVYNRPLSATEVLSNYNALKSTYGH